MLAHSGTDRYLSYVGIHNVEGIYVAGMCEVAGCGRPHKARGFCAAHYQQFKRGDEVAPVINARVAIPEGATCTAPGCDRPVKSRDLCKAHYARLRRHGHIEQTRVRLECSIVGCSEPSVAKTFCQKHYYRQMRSGTTDDPKVRLDEFAKCSVGGCTNVAKARGFCGMHYARFLRHEHVLETRAADWGARERHPLYPVWINLLRGNRPHTCDRWHDLWNFVADIGESRPSVAHLLTRKSDLLPFGPDNFYWRAPRVSGKSDDKKAEHAAYMRDWYAANGDKLLEREMQKRYGISFADYVRMFDDQNGLCAICDRPEARIDHRTKKVSRLAVDHDHKTGAVRALLCHACNVSLGGFNDDRDRLARAIAYLDRHADKSRLLPTSA